MRVPLLNFEGGPGVLLLNFEGGPGVPLLNFEKEPGSRVPGSPGRRSGVLVPTLHHVKFYNLNLNLMRETVLKSHKRLLSLFRFFR